MNQARIEASTQGLQSILLVYQSRAYKKKLERIT